MGRNTIFILAAIWLILFAGAFLVFQIIPPEGSGFTRGTNRLGPFALMHLGALIAAIIALLTVLKLPRPWTGPQVLAGFTPISVSGFLILVVVGMLAWAIFGKPPPVEPTTPGPVTELPVTTE